MSKKIKHTINHQDLVQNPLLARNGLVRGQEVTIVVGEVKGDVKKNISKNKKVQAADDEQGGKIHPGGNPIHP